MFAGCLRRGFTALCKDRDTAIELVNSLAPEHLELMVDGAAEMAESISNAGLILTGPYAPGAASDYCIGTDHVLPTEGVARLRAGLTALDFVKVSWVVGGHEARPEDAAPVAQGARHGRGPAEPLPVCPVEVPEAMTQRSSGALEEQARGRLLSSRARARREGGSPSTGRRGTSSERWTRWSSTATAS